MRSVLRMQSDLPPESTEGKAVTSVEKQDCTPDSRPRSHHPSGLHWAHRSFDPDTVRRQALDGLDTERSPRGGFRTPRQQPDA